MAEVATDESHTAPIEHRRMRLAALLEPLVRWIVGDWQRTPSVSTLHKREMSGADVSWQTGLAGQDTRRMIDHAHR